EADDLVDLGVLGRDHDDRHPAALPQRAAEVEAAHAGEHEVEEDQVRPRGAGGAQAGRAVARLLHGEACGRQVVLEHLANALVVLDHQDPAGAPVRGGPRHPSSTTWPMSPNSARSGWSGSATRVVVMRAMRTE